MDEGNIEFRELTLPSKENHIFRVFYIIENGRSQVMDGFQSMPIGTMDQVKDLIIKMATVENFKSPKIRWRLRKYAYGELKPKGYRFFFFIKFGNNIILFRYSKKKADSLGDAFYKDIEMQKRRYEGEFEKRIQGY